MVRRITFGELSRLLEGMGFEQVNLPTHVLFEHTSSDTKVVLRPYQAREVVNLTDVAVVRKTLDERGLMQAEAFENFMRRKPA